LILDIIEF